MYTKKNFGRELKEKVRQQENIERIADSAHSMYIERIEDVDLGFRDLLLGLGTMELGPQFAYTYEELDQIADDFIAGKDVKL